MDYLTPRIQQIERVKRVTIANLDEGRVSDFLYTLYYLISKDLTFFDGSDGDLEIAEVNGKLTLNKITIYGLRLGYYIN